MLRYNISNKRIDTNYFKLSVREIMHPSVFITDENVETLAFIYKGKWVDMNGNVVEGESTDDIDESVLVYVCDENHNFNDGETLRLTRNDGTVSFEENITVNVINEKIFHTEAFGYVELTSQSNSFFYGKRYFSDEYALYIRLFLDEPHFCESDRTGVEIMENLNDENYTISRRDKTRCVGDYVTYNTLFLHRSTIIDEENRYYVDLATIANTKADMYIYNNATEEEYFTDGENIEGIVPCRLDGTDDTDSILVRFKLNESGDTVIDGIINESGDTEIYNLTFYLSDNRFIEDRETVRIMNGVEFFRVEDRINLSFPLEQGIVTELFNDMIISDFINSEINGAVNGIIDFEKQQFTPVDSEGNDIDKIKFNVHLREREMSETIEDNVEIIDFGTWDTDDNKFWNNYILSGSTLVPKHGLNPNDSDLIGYMGFSDDDIYYHKNRLKKTFIRISFYDSPKRTVQKLLFYSTIFIDINELYGKYTKLSNDNVAMDKMYTFTEPENKELRLCSNFYCSKKGNTDRSSEGFYIYLFPDIVDNKEDREETIYMKIDFNNAKYGKTVPLTMPTDENGIISPTSQDFPYNYFREDENFRMIDMERVNKDRYIAIKVRYNKEKNRYEYFLPNTDSVDGTVELNLFEPRLNKSSENEGK